jgi:hypothetical protein
VKPQEVEEIFRKRVDGIVTSKDVSYNEKVFGSYVVHIYVDGNFKFEVINGRGRFYINIILDNGSKVQSHLIFKDVLSLYSKGQWSLEDIIDVII